MPQTASGTVVNRTSLTRAAAAMLALAYLRNAADGEWVRASAALSEFQRFWNERRSALVDPNETITGIPGALAVTGILDDPTQFAVMFSLWQNNIISTEVAGLTPWGEYGLIQQVFSQVNLASSSPLWEAFNVSRRVAAQDAGPELQAWAWGFAEGLAEPSPPTSAASRDNAPIQVGEEFHIPGLVVKRTTRPLWPWAVAGVGLTLVVGGLVYRMKKRRRRRR